MHITLKYLKFFLFIAISINILFYYFKPTLYELRLNIDKYTQRNISQNQGLHKLVLIMIKKATFFLPKYDQVELKKDIIDVGVGLYITPPPRFDSKNIYVQTADEIVTAISTSLPNTIINILPGHYKFSGKSIKFKSSGKQFEPIILKADTLGEVIFEMDLYEGIIISTSYIKIENIIFKGIKNKTDSQEHAIHLTKNADFVEIAHNEFINFNAHIKSNGVFTKDGVNHFPDNVVITHNNFYNQWKRNTRSPSIPIDVVGGNNWVIKNNFIADFGKYGKKGEGITYGLYLKGAGKNGLIENNLVACEWQVPHTSPNDVRIGISLGGGGTGKRYCMDKTCNYEHNGGVIRNNTIVNCKNDVAIYINKGKNTKIYSNYIVNSLGIDIRFPSSSADIYDNYLDGRIKARQGAKLNKSNNQKSKEYLGGS